MIQCSALYTNKPIDDSALKRDEMPLFMPMLLIPITLMDRSKGHEYYIRAPADLNEGTSLLCVGASTQDGGSVSSRTLNTRYINARAPEEHVQWSLKNKESSTGTSSASATVAGLAAYWMSTTQFKQRPNPKPLAQPGYEVRDWIIQYSYPRKQGGPKVIWNGFDSSVIRKACEKGKAVS